MSGFLELFSQYDVLGAFLVNIELTLWSALFSLILGVILVVMRISPISSLRAVAGAYVELFKNLPLTIIMVFMVLGAYAQLKLSFSDTFTTNFFWLAVTGLSLYTAAFVCESLRSGINTVPIGQAEAARALGLGFMQSATEIILPQAFRGTARQHADRPAQELHRGRRRIRGHRNILADERDDRIPSRRDHPNLPDLRARLRDPDHPHRHAHHVPVQQTRRKEVTDMADTSNSVLFDAPGPKGRRTIRIVNWIAGILFAVVLVFILMRLHNPPDGENQLSWELWKPAVEREAWTDFYLPGLWMTIKATIVAVVGAVVFGLVFGVGRLLPNPLVRGVSAVIVEFCRAVPVLLLMIFFWRWFAFAGLPSPSYWAVVLALVLYNGSVVAELVRSGVGNLPGGQREASLALGLTETQSLMEIEVPQAVYAMLPAAVTQLVVVLKDTALGSIIMYTDLLQESRRLGSMYFNILQTLVMAAVIYFIACWLLSRLAEWLPSRMQQRTAAPAEPEPLAPIAAGDPSNVNQIAVAKEVEELPLGGTPRKYHVHHRGTNASIRNWRRTRYEQGYDATQPESQVDPETGEFQESQKPEDKPEA